MKELGRKILDWTSKILKTDMRYLAVGGFWLTLSQVAAVAASFGLSVAFANLMSKDGYGIYKYIMSLGSLAAIFSLTGINNAVMQAVVRGADGTLQRSVATKLKWSALGSAVTLLAATYYHFAGNIHLSQGLFIVGLTLPFFNTYSIYLAFLNAKRLFKQYAVFSLLTTIFSAASIFAAIALTHDPVWTIFVYFLSNLIPYFIFYWITVKRYQSNKVDDPTAISYGKHLSLMDVIGTFLGQLDGILIFHYLGAAELAVFTIATAPTEQLKGLLKNIQSLAFPKFAERSWKEIRENIFKKSLTLFLITTAAVLAYIVSAPFLFSIFFPKYLISIGPSQVAAISIIPITVAMLLYTSLEAQRKTKALYVFNISNNLINAVVLFPLIYFFGLWGAVLARLIIRSILLLFIALQVKRQRD